MPATAINTGSTKGIGKATATLLAKRGLNVVVISSRNQSDVDRTVKEIKTFSAVNGDEERPKPKVENFQSDKLSSIQNVSGVAIVIMCM
jgi:3-oxoacyl-[acyl-carrier protein] reductase